MEETLLPIDTINDKGFRTMINMFETCYTPPDRKMLSTKYLPQMFETEKKCVGNLLGSVQYYSCTTNLKTSRAKHTYISLTVHYLATDFSLQSHWLETKEFSDSHTGLNITEELEAALQKRGLSLDRLTAFSTDNGSNHYLCNRVSCFSHCLNLAVEKTCSIVKSYCSMSLCSFTFRSYLLKQKEDLCHPSQIWSRNSAYYMVSRIVEQQQPLSAALLELKKADLFHPWKLMLKWWNLASCMYSLGWLSVKNSWRHHRIDQCF